jgi:hypothetical protein
VLPASLPAHLRHLPALLAILPADLDALPALFAIYRRVQALYRHLPPKNSREKSICISKNGIFKEFNRKNVLKSH